MVPSFHRGSVICTLCSGTGTWRHPKVPVRWNLPPPAPGPKGPRAAGCLQPKITGKWRKACRPGNAMAGSGPPPVAAAGRPATGPSQRRYGGSRRRIACRSAMVEPTVTAPERDVLLATKLDMPASQPAQVLRPRLAARLDEGLTRGLTLAGAQNTARRSCWPTGPGAAGTRSPGSRWTRGTTPARFWRHAVAALDRAAPGSANGGPAARPARAVVVPGPGHGADQRAGRGGGPAGPRRLPRDRLAAGARVARVLAEHRPAGLRVALASRSDPPLALPRLRARGR